MISIVGNAGLAFQQKLIDAAVDAGVKRFIPSEFGNNTADDRVRALAPLLDGKKANVDYLKERQDRLTWTALITGPFFDAVSRSTAHTYNTYHLLRPIHEGMLRRYHNRVSRTAF